MDKYEAVLDIIGIDAPIANALRRIMISEVYIFIIIRSQLWLLKKYYCIKIHLLFLMKFWSID